MIKNFTGTAILVCAALSLVGSAAVLLTFAIHQPWTGTMCNRKHLLFILTLLVLLQSCMVVIAINPDKSNFLCDLEAMIIVVTGPPSLMYAAAIAIDSYYVLHNMQLCSGKGHAQASHGSTGVCNNPEMEHVSSVDRNRATSIDYFARGGELESEVGYPNFLPSFTFSFGGDSNGGGSGDGGSGGGDGGGGNRATDTNNQTKRQAKDNEIESTQSPLQSNQNNAVDEQQHNPNETDYDSNMRGACSAIMDAWTTIPQRYRYMHLCVLVYTALALSMLNEYVDVQSYVGKGYICTYGRGALTTVFCILPIFCCVFCIFAANYFIASTLLRLYTGETSWRAFIAVYEAMNTHSRAELRRLVTFPLFYFFNTTLLMVMSPLSFSDNSMASLPMTVAACNALLVGVGISIIFVFSDGTVMQSWYALLRLRMSASNADTARAAAGTAAMAKQGETELAPPLGFT